MGFSFNIAFNSAIRKYQNVENRCYKEYHNCGAVYRCEFFIWMLLLCFMIVASILIYNNLLTIVIHHETYCHNYYEATIILCLISWWNTIIFPCKSDCLYRRITTLSRVDINFFIKQSIQDVYWGQDDTFTYVVENETHVFG